MVGPLRRHRDASIRVTPSSSHAVLEKELTWFFTEAEIATSFASNFEALKDVALSGRRVPMCNVPDPRGVARMEAACTAGTIERRLRRMQDPHAGVLRAAFEPRAWPEALEALLGPLTGIVVRLAAARQQRRSTDAGAGPRRELEVARALTVSFEEGGPSRLEALRDVAVDLYARALRAYAKVRGLGPSVVPEREEDRHET